MKSKHNKHGFVIPLTLMLIAVAMVLITGIYQKGTIFVPFISTMMKREQAKMLALSGVQVAMSQIAIASAPKDEKKIPKHQRILRFHFWTNDLPKTSTMKTKRKRQAITDSGFENVRFQQMQAGGEALTPEEQENFQRGRAFRGQAGTSR